MPRRLQRGGHSIPASACVMMWHFTSRYTRAAPCRVMPCRATTLYITCAVSCFYFVNVHATVYSHVRTPRSCALIEVSGTQARTLRRDFWRPSAPERCSSWTSARGATCGNWPCGSHSSGRYQTSTHHSAVPQHGMASPRTWSVQQSANLTRLDHQPDTHVPRSRMVLFFISSTNRHRPWRTW